MFTTVLLGAIALGFILYTGDPWAALARLRGETLIVTPAVTQFGEGIEGETRTFEVTLTNHSDTPIRVVGGTTTCSCIATQDLPMEIPSRGARMIHVTAKFSGSVGRFSHRFVLLSDGEKPLTIAHFAGKVIPTKQTHGESEQQVTLTVSH